MFLLKIRDMKIFQLRFLEDITLDIFNCCTNRIYAKHYHWSSNFFVISILRSFIDYRSTNIKFHQTVPNNFSSCCLYFYYIHVCIQLYWVILSEISVYVSHLLFFWEFVTVANNNFSLFFSPVYCDETFYYFRSLPERLQDFLSRKSFYCCLFHLQTTTTTAAASTQGNRPLNIFVKWNMIFYMSN